MFYHASLELNGPTADFIAIYILLVLFALRLIRVAGLKKGSGDRNRDNNRSN